MKAHGLSDVGKVRQNNEDNYYCGTTNLFIVADGLGGHSAGEVASEMTVSYVANGKPQNVDDLVQRIAEANNNVFLEAKKLGNDMATTISAMLVTGGKSYVAHVGDSRIYLIRADKIYAITDDHTPVMESLRAGLITEEQARTHPLKHMLSRTIGTHQEVEIDTISVDLEVKDIFVLCTDGLSNLLEEDDIYDVVKSSNNSTEEMCKKLVDMANHRGGVDNVTVVVTEIEASEIVEDTEIKQ
ncbi:MAG: Stp1/IreP family PP2C-type Ser/Thr phosphatase [Candidatus Sericytochromatia bacterium]|nr:Stp1/IreP family PP2C-type Ser/Thr phosphatase [Candidatus Sericytochromatia bacterium]